MNNTLDVTSLYYYIGKTPLEIARSGNAALANQLIQSGKIHISHNHIVPGPDKYKSPLLVCITTDPVVINILADSLSKEQ